MNKALGKKCEEARSRTPRGLEAGRIGADEKRKTKRTIFRLRKTPTGTPGQYQRCGGNTEESQKIRAEVYKSFLYGRSQIKILIAHHQFRGDSRRGKKSR